MSSPPLDLCYNRSYVISRHMITIGLQQNLNPTLHHLLKAAMPPMPNSAMSRVELCQANAVTLNEITKRGAYVHEGRFVVIRTIVPSCKLAAVQSVVDDPDGDIAVLFTLYNYNQNSLPVGLIAAVMNPYFNQNKDHLVLCCNNPSAHFVVLSSEHPLLKDVVWKATLPFRSQVDCDDDCDFNKAGVRYFKENNFPKALELFTKALEDKKVSEIQRHVSLFVNRSATLLALGRWQNALEDAEAGLKLDSGNAKLLARKANALMKLGQFVKCVDFLETKQTKLGGDLLTRARRALSESRNGDFDFKQLAKESRQNLQLDGHGDFFAQDLVEVREVSGFGRGLVAKQDIPAGQLLIGEKALAFEKHEAPVLPIQNGVDTSGVGVVRCLFDRLPFDLQLRKVVYDLYAGSGFPTATLAKVKSEVVDFERVKAVVQANCFATDCPPKSCGLWRYASYINHTCIDENVTRFFIGDFIFVRAFREIKKGQQLLLSYVPRLDEFSARDVALRVRRGFVCECRLCQIDRNDPVDVQERLVEICNKAMQMQLSSMQDIREMERLFKEALSLRPCFELNQTAMVIGSALASIYVMKGDYTKAIRLYEETASAMEAAGLVLLALTTYLHMKAVPANKLQKRKWQLKIDDLVKVFTGDFEVFNELYGPGNWNFGYN